LLPTRFPGLKGLDRWVIEHVFPSLREGYFVEAGAVDGIQISNTLVLEKHFGWHGLLVEGTPQWLDSLRSCRENSTSRVAILASSDHSLHLRVTSVGNDTNKLGTRFYPITAEQEEFAMQAAAQVHPNSELLVDRSTPSRTLWRLLDEAKAPKFIHFLSLDIEGFEWDALRLFPFDRYTFGALSIEHAFQHNYADASRITKLLLENGYVRERRWNDDLWLHSSVAEQVAKRWAERRRRRRHTPRRASFAGGHDFDSLPECTRMNQRAL